VRERGRGAREGCFEASLSSERGYCWARGGVGRAPCHSLSSPCCGKLGWLPGPYPSPFRSASVGESGFEAEANESSQLRASVEAEASEFFQLRASGENSGGRGK
jgi:hypothetical protein